MIRGIFRVFILLLCGLLISCGSSANSAKLDPNTKILSDGDAKTITYVSPGQDTIVFQNSSGMARSLSVGDIVVANVSEQTPLGLLRKVRDVQKTEDKIIVTTDASSLEDFVEEGQAEHSQALLPGAVTSAVALTDGVSFSEARPDANKYATESERALYKARTFRIEIYKKFKVKDSNGDWVSVGMNGGFEFTPEFHFKMKIRKFKLKEFHLSHNATESMNFGVSAEGGVSIKENIQIAEYWFEPITVWVGILPVVITPKLVVNVGLEGTVSLNLKCGLEQAARYNIGVEKKDGEWNTIKEFTNEFNFDRPEFEEKMTVKAYAGPELDILVYGVVGPNLKLQGYLELVAAMPVADSPPHWDLYAGIEALAGVNIAILSYDIVDVSWTLIGYKVWLAGSDRNTNAVSQAEVSIVPAENQSEAVIDSRDISDERGEAMLLTNTAEATPYLQVGVQSVH